MKYSSFSMVCEYSSFSMVCGQGDRCVEGVSVVVGEGISLRARGGGVVDLCVSGGKEWKGAI